MNALLAGAVAVVAIGGVLAFAIEDADIPPRRLAPYVERRASGHHPVIERTGRWIADALFALDRERHEPHLLLAMPAAQFQALPQRTRGARGPVLVGSSEEARHAIAEAEPGDVITFLPGRYRFTGSSIDARRPGTAAAPIVVRAETPGSVVLEFDIVEGFHVSAPYWTFEDLTIRGVCADHSSCEHAFHVVGGATHFAARRNTIVDFNAHFKVNGSGGAYPDFGVIEGNVIRNSGVRNTGNAVTTIDIVAASHWRIRGNRISDFAKAQSDRISYGAFAKGGGVDNRFEQNVVVCEERLYDVPGQRVGLSLGGGGTDNDACRERACVTEQDQGVIASNLVASCSDDGIYLNRAARSRVAHNTLVDTAGITARFAETSADVDGNLVDGVIRGVAGAALHADDNFITPMTQLYLGMHPVRRLFVDAPALDLRWRGDRPRRSDVGQPPPDLCGARSPEPAYGAFDDIQRCPVRAR